MGYNGPIKLNIEVLDSGSVRVYLEIKPYPFHLKRGDHIYVPRLWGLYYHHGIFLGNEKVLHVTPSVPAHQRWNMGSGSGSLNASYCIRIDDLNTFQYYPNTPLLKEVNPIYDNEFDRQNIKYENMTGKHDYSLIHNNCEHFCTSTLTRDALKVSYQIESWVSRLKNGSLFSGLSGVCGAISKLCLMDVSICALSLSGFAIGLLYNGKIKYIK